MNINEENKDLDKKGEFVIIPDEFKNHFNIGPNFAHNDVKNIRHPRVPI
jgi:hypothetical protein